MQLFQRAGLQDTITWSNLYRSRSRNCLVTDKVRMATSSITCPATYKSQETTGWFLHEREIKESVPVTFTQTSLNLLPTLRNATCTVPQGRLPYDSHPENHSTSSTQDQWHRDLALGWIPGWPFGRHQPWDPKPCILNHSPSLPQEEQTARVEIKEPRCRNLDKVPVTQPTVNGP
jgi:hypothetical protein